MKKEMESITNNNNNISTSCCEEKSNNTNFAESKCVFYSRK